MLDAQIEAIISQAIADHVFPGAVVGYHKAGATQVLPFGRLTYDTDAPVVTTDTVYDLASITKSIPTAVVILALVEQGLLSLDDPVERFLPEMASTSGAAIHIRHLLTYTAVFDINRRLSTYPDRATILQAIYTTPLKYPPGQHYAYNDAPYILLGLVVEKVAGKPLDAVAEELFFTPLGMHSTTFRPKELPGAIIAPTEEGVAVGEPHDEKARAFFREGYAAGHAGLFSAASDLLTLCQMLLNGGSYREHHYFQPATVKQMSTQIFEEDSYGVSLGWRTKHPGFMRAGLPPHLFGKEGFTGPMVLLDPDANTGLVLLCNRTYPKRPESPTAMQQVRRSLEDALFA